jgi:hypothetical protein
MIAEIGDTILGCVGMICGAACFIALFYFATKD